MMSYQIFPGSDEESTGRQCLFVIEVSPHDPTSLAKALQEAKDRTDRGRLVSVVRIMDDELNQGGTIRRFVATYIVSTYS